MAIDAEIISWHDAGKALPDADTTVLIIPGGDVEAWLGFTDGERWFYIDAMPCDRVISWAHLPTGPAANGELAQIWSVLTDWLKFSSDVQAGCAAGAEWLDELRVRTRALLAPNPPIGSDRTTRE